MLETIKAVFGAGWSAWGGKIKLAIGIGAIIAIGLYVLSRETKIARLENKVDQRTAQIAAIVASNRIERAERSREQQSNINRVRNQQEAINDRFETENRASDDAWRARFDRLRKSQRDRGSVERAAMPASVAATGSADGADRDPGELADPEMIAVRIDDLETLVRGAQRGRDLQRAAAEQAKIETSPQPEGRR
jgi:hypothetical protein